MTAEYKCMATYEGTPNIPNLVSITNSWASSGKIDKPSNLKDDKIYLFSGSGDTVVHPEVMHSLETYYTQYVSSTQILSNFNLKSEHCIPTLSFGEACATLGSPYIGKCNYD